MLQETLIEKRETLPHAGSDPTELQRIPDEGGIDLIELAALLLRGKKDRKSVV